ncbi:MAG: radical SAM family heme chaperone HemW [Gammaproteobacteria bacterium]|nr:radical SAM family heme chaperone HemW [Gammaproteobacteria bacterium]
MILPPLSLYIHLPWCERKCPYCDFNSHETDKLPEAEYLAALVADVRADAPMAYGRTVQSVFIGGGTPSLFSSAAIARLLEAVSNLLPLQTNAEITMEANPGSAEAGKFRGFRRAGVNRLSLGIQSFSDRHLQTLGRVHTGAQARAAIEMAHREFDNLNIDLMHGLPGQSTDEARNDLATAIDCSPTHLSWYQLTIEPNTRFFNNPPVLPRDDTLADIQACGEALLTTAGYSQYEVSAYSTLARRSAHNLNYWTFGDYLGIGAGAHGKITHPDGRIERYSKVRQPADYLAREAGNFIARKQAVPLQDLPGEFAMNALRLREGIDPELYSQRTRQDSQTFMATAQRLADRGLLLLEDGRMRATALGFLHLDSVIAEFFPDAPR